MAEISGGVFSLPSILATAMSRLLGGHFVGDFADFIGDFAVAAAHEALDRIDRVLRVGDGLALGGLADEALAVFGEGDHRGRGAALLRSWR